MLTNIWDLQSRISGITPHVGAHTTQDAGSLCLCDLLGPLDKGIALTTHSNSMTATAKVCLDFVHGLH